MSFYKYHGTGNDFILFDNRANEYSFTREEVAALCHRRFGIGADGLMLLELAEGYDFRMVYYNSDGNESSMCGNGGRCLVAFAHFLGIVQDKTKFIATDGPHEATITEDGIINLQMKDVSGIHVRDGYAILDTGSPHYVKWVADSAAVNVAAEGRNIRNSPEFIEKGINVNFTQITADGISVRTYERGVEDETMSCGTGVTAAAIAASGSATGRFTTHISTPGGSLTVSFTKELPDTAKNVVLSGPAMFVFHGDTHDS